MNCLASARYMHPYDLWHGLAVALLVSACATVYAISRRLSDESSRRRFEYAIAAGILLARLATFIADLSPSRLSLGRSLPLHVCDIAGFCAVCAIAFKWTWARVVTVFLGSALCVVPFLSPICSEGPAHWNYWLYFGGHAAILVAVVYELAVRHFRLSFAQFVFMVRFGVIYTLVVSIFDFLFDVNYAYLGNTPDGPRSILSQLGPWPWRVPLLLTIALGFMGLVFLAFRDRSSDIPATNDTDLSTDDSLPQTAN